MLRWFPNVVYVLHKESCSVEIKHEKFPSVIRYVLENVVPENVLQRYNYMSGEHKNQADSNKRCTVWPTKKNNNPCRDHKLLTDMTNYSHFIYLLSENSVTQLLLTHSKGNKPIAVQKPLRYLQQLRRSSILIGSPPEVLRSTTVPMDSVWGEYSERNILIFI